MFHKTSLLKFFPNSSVAEISHGAGYLVSVVDQEGSVLISEYGRTIKDAWRNAHFRVYQIWKPLLSVTAATILLMNDNREEKEVIKRREP